MFRRKRLKGKPIFDLEDPSDIENEENEAKREKNKEEIYDEKEFGATGNILPADMTPKKFDDLPSELRSAIFQCLDFFSQYRIDDRLRRFASQLSSEAEVRHADVRTKPLLGYG